MFSDFKQGNTQKGYDDKPKKVIFDNHTDGYPNNGQNSAKTLDYNRVQIEKIDNFLHVLNALAPSLEDCLHKAHSLANHLEDETACYRIEQFYATIHPQIIEMTRLRLELIRLRFQLSGD